MKLGTGAILITIFIGVIFGIVLLDSSADRVSESQLTLTITNNTITLPAAIGGTIELQGRDLISITAIVDSDNSSNVDYSGNVSLGTGVGTNGNATVILTLLGTQADGRAINGTGANVSYVANRQGTVSGGAGNMLVVVLVVAALAILVFILQGMMGNQGPLSKLLNKTFKGKIMVSKGFANKRSSFKRRK